MTFDIIIPAGGLSVRTGFDKLTTNLGEITVLQRTVNAFLSLPEVDKIIVVGKKIDGDKIVCVQGGATRHESVKNGLKEVVSPYVLIHDAARPFVDEALIRRVMDATIEYGAAIPAIKSTDSLRTVKDEFIVDSVDRESTVLVQTPQGFATEKIKFAFDMAQDTAYTDESELYARYVSPCRVVDGDVNNKKITYSTDFFGINARVGTGFDLHRFTPGKPLKLCGVTIDYPYGLLAHSDGDAPLHALMDALLTSVGERDIGVLFPDTDPEYKDADSAMLLQTVLSILKEKNAAIISVNLTIIAQAPKLSPYIEQMRQNLSALLSVSPSIVSLSATTTEELGLIGEKKALAAIASVVVQ